MKITKQAVSGLCLPEGKTERFEWDDDLPGFGVRLRGDTKRWVVQYRVGPQQRRESLGDVRKVPLEDARKAARTRFAQVELGTDPGAEKAKTRKQAEAVKLTLAVAADRYLDAKQERLRPSTYGQAKLHFTNHWKPLRKRPLEEIKRADVAARLQELIKESGKTAAARARSNLSALYGWAMREGLCEGNPVIATNDPAEGILPRERVLADDELRVIWKACRDDDFGRIVRLLMLTGCRREEIGGLKYKEINLDTGVLIIPCERTKNRRELELTLPDAALQILRSAPRIADRDFVFGGSGGTYSAWSYATQALFERITRAQDKPLRHWTLHDLRRTFRTGLARIGVLPHIAELAINHVKGGVEAIYDRHRYQKEINAALVMWADHIRSIVEGGERKVVSLRSAM